jgi:copper(I)-binding protein
MRKVENISVPAGQTVELKRGGLHVMLIDLQKRPMDGETVHLELEFEKAGKIALDAPVKKAEMKKSMMH